MSWTLFIQVLILLIVGTICLNFVVDTIMERRNKW